MKRRAAVSLMALAIVVGSGAAAYAHVSFVKRRVPVAATIESTLRVPHGCDGSPTLRLRMRLPAAVTAVRPRVKDGWTVSLAGQGAAREIAWSGPLPAKQTGEFSFAMDLDASVKAGDVLYFPLVQECEKGVSRWIDVKGRPSADAPESDDHDESTSPAPSIRFLPRK